MPWNPPKITDEGLKSYLDRTAEKHGGMRYADFKKMMQYRDKGSRAAVSINGVARLFQVDYRTIKKWIEIYYEEKQTV